MQIGLKVKVPVEQPSNTGSKNSGLMVTEYLAGRKTLIGCTTPNMYPVSAGLLSPNLRSILKSRNFMQLRILFISRKNCRTNPGERRIPHILRPRPFFLGSFFFFTGFFFGVDLSGQLTRPNNQTKDSFSLGCRLLSTLKTKLIGITSRMITSRIMQVRVMRNHN